MCGVLRAGAVCRLRRPAYDGGAGAISAVSPIRFRSTPNPPCLDGYRATSNLTLGRSAPAFAASSTAPQTLDQGASFLARTTAAGAPGGATLIRALRNERRTIPSGDG